MALFPAYTDSSHGDSISPDNEELNERSLLKLEKELDEEVGVSDVSPETESKLLNPVEDTEDSDSSSRSEADEETLKKRKHKSHRKKDKKRRKKEKDSGKHKSQSEIKNADYYTDCKLDYGNLRVSTLYNPARPQYEYIRMILGNINSSKSRKHKDKRKRYFNTTYQCATIEDDEESKTQKKSRPKKNLEGYIDITDSGITWSDSRIDEDLVDKTAQFNKNLNSNPYDVEEWLKYVRLQEDRMAFDICNARVSSEAVARNICHSKQLSILNRALETNYNSIELLTMKVKISELSMPNDQYLAMLKTLVTTPGLNASQVLRVWCWYVEAVQCSMALCSVGSVREMYTAAIKGLVKAQGAAYQESHLDVMYRLGLFLRQAGMWEQLWMLVQMNMEMNLAQSKGHPTVCFDDVLPKIDENALADDENKIISSGLPLHSVWCRVESLRCRLHWLPAPHEAVDPQRIVFSTDMADFIKPVTLKTQQFALIVTILRLYKIPLLPMRHTMLSSLSPSNIPIEWEYECIESCLPFVYSVIDSFGMKDPIQMKILATIFKDFSEEPNYFEVTGHFYNFISKLMLQCAKCLSGNEATAILIWWIRLQRCILATLRWKDINEQKTAFSRVRKSVKDVLKEHREEVLLYRELALLEGQVVGPARGLTVLETSLRAVPCNKSISRIHLARSYVELVLKESHSVENIVTSINTLIALATCQPLPKNMCQPCSDQHIEEALAEFSGHTDTLLLGVSQFDREMALVEHLVPSEAVDWLCCHGWLLYLTQGNESLLKFYKKLDIATDVAKVEDKALDCKRKLWLRENLLEWFISITRSNIRASPEKSGENALSETVLLQGSWEQFPSSAGISWGCAAAWSCAGPLPRWRLLSALKGACGLRPPHLLAMATLLHHFIHMYHKEVPLYEDSWQVGHSHRLQRLLRELCQQPGLSRSALLWKMYFTFISSQLNQSIDDCKRILYRALDECPWNKGLYQLGCTHLPPQFAELLDLMLEKQLRLHAMPEELEL